MFPEKKKGLKNARPSDERSLSHSTSMPWTSACCAFVNVSTMLSSLPAPWTVSIGRSMSL